MAIKLVGGTQDSFDRELTVTAGVAIADGDALDLVGNIAQRATNSSNIHTLHAIATETINTTDTKIKAKRIVPGQVWEVDTANDTDDTELYEGMILTNHDTINNTDTNVTGPTAVFTCLAIKGNSSDRKLIGEFITMRPTSN